ncbi:alkylhydroperoxidase AhpD [Neisseria wadsworthii 9715]|uniref:Alkylhydroperoxidase AhpD n=1 Tax=Neisseria wadsworthii 9715 TaxID=1030841 RepID=G4CQM6_9NEIS|nr:alkylhydroperoxidase AhpD [Neisseria wadsworthii 9715]
MVANFKRGLGQWQCYVRLAGENACLKTFRQGVRWNDGADSLYNCAFYKPFI